MVHQGRIPNRLRKFRLMYGLTQTEVAKKLGMKRPTLISQWEKGSIAPSFENLIDLARIYQTLIEELYLDYYLTRKVYWDNQVSQ